MPRHSSRGRLFQRLWRQNSSEARTTTELITDTTNVQRPIQDAEPTASWTLEEPIATHEPGVYPAIPV